MSSWIFALSIVVLGSDAVFGGEPPDFVLEWGSAGAGPGQFGGMHGIEVDDYGIVYVVDTGNNRVQKFAGDGTFLMQWGSFGSGPGQFNHPHGVGIGPLGNLYVAETGNNRVQKFTSDGTFITMWGSFGAGDGQFQHNHGLGVDSQGNVFVADRNQNRVQKFTNDGTFILAFGTPGTGDGQFTGTNGVAVDGDDNVFVGDSSPRIQKFTNDGIFITSWGSAGTGDGQFNFPRGLSTDDFGNVYVCDRNLHRMQKFTGTGEFVTKWGSFGNGEGQFNLPYAIRAVENGLVYVSDSSNFRVQLFSFPTPIECGNGVVDMGEECDDGVSNSDIEPDACRTDCTGAACGDGVVDTAEECDDGNTVLDDGCDADCQLELGACCVGTACSIVVQAACSNVSGTFLGFNSSCVMPDTDGDGLRNECDGCPNDPVKIDPGICGCGLDDSADVDGDGVPDCDDQCRGVDDSIFAPQCVSAIPAVSTWGVIVLALLLLTGAKLLSVIGNGNAHRILSQ